jgi:general secretion pathway protein C
MELTAWKLWMPRLAAFMVGLLLAASVVFWVLRWPVRDSGREVPLAAADEVLAPADAKTIARWLGAQAAPDSSPVPDAASRFKLTGIIASAGREQSVALVSIDGKPPKPYHVGSQLEEGLMLQSVAQRHVALAADAKAPVRLQLELPPRQP